MAETIGGVVVEITGDYSGLQSDFDAAVAIAVSKGATLAEAINAALKLPDTTPLADALALIGSQSDAAAGHLDSMKGALDSVAQAAENYAGSAEAIMQAQRDADEQLTEAVGALSTILGLYREGSASADDLARAEDAVASAFDKASPSIEKAGQGVHDAGEHAHEASGSFGEMAEKLTALGEALIITEGLRELAAEALAAADNVTRASIALTAITGSAEAAETTIKGLESLGMSDGLSFPSLYTAGTRMQQLLGPGADVVGILGQIADGAAVMGTDIGSAANAFDRLVTSGNASAKTLMPLGLNVSELADAMNRLYPSLDATAESAKKLFKDALTDDGRIAVLQTALEGLGGTAAKVADETFGGQWQKLENQWELVMADVGKALMPVITDLTSFASAVLDVAKQAADGFASLPGPVKDAAVAVGVLLAAVIPVTAALAAVGLAIEGLATLGAAASGVFEVIGGAAAAADISIGILGLSLSEIIIPIGLLAAAVAAVHFSGLDQEASDFASNLKGDFEGISDLFTPVTDGVETMFAAMSTGVSDAVTPFEDAIKEAWSTLSEGIGSALSPVTDALGHLWDKLKEGVSTDASAAMEKLGDALDHVKTNAQPATDALGRMKEVLTDTTPKQEAFIAAVGAGNPVLAGLADALAAASNALDFLGGRYQVMTDAMTKGNPVMADNAKNMHDAAQAAMEAAGLFDKATQSTSGLKEAAAQLADKFKAIPWAQTSDEAAVLVAAEQRAISAHNAMIQQIAASGQTVHQFWANMLADSQFFMNGAAASIPPVIADLGALDMAIKPIGKSLQALFDEATLTSMGKFGKAAHDLGVDLAATGPDITAMATDLGVLEKAAADGTITWDQVSTGINKVAKAIGDLAKSDLPTATEEFGQMTQGLIDGGAPLSIIETELGKFQGYIQKLAKEDLPAAVDAQGKYIDQLRQIGAPISEIVKNTIEWDKMQIQLAEDSGKSASQYIANLDLMKQKSVDAHDSIKNLWGNVFTDLQKSWNDAFDKMGKSIADNIVAGKSWADTWHTFVKQIETEILESLIGTAFKALRSELDSLIGSLFPSLQGAITGTGGAIGGLAGAATSATKGVAGIGEAATDAFPSISKAGSSAAGLASGASSAAGSLVSMVGAIGSVIGAIAGIAGDILQAHANNLLGEIEINTRSMFNETTNRRADAWSQFGQTYGRLGEIINLLQSMQGSGGGISAGDKSITDALSGMAQTLTDISSHTYDAAQALQDGIKVMGSGGGGGTTDLAGQSLAVLQASQRILQNIASEIALSNLGLQNIAIDIQALGSASAQGAADFKNLFTNAQTTTAGQIATITKQISDNNAQIAVALASNNKALADSLTNQNVALQAHLDALNALKTSTTATATSTATTATNTNGLKESLGAAAEATRQASQTQVEAIGRGIGSLIGPLDIIASNTGTFGESLAALGGHIDNLGGQLANLAESAGRAAANGTGQGNPGTTATSTPVPTTSAAPPPTTSAPSGKASAIPKKSFDLGGFNPVDQIVSLHANEWVIPPSPATIALPMDVLSRIRIPDMPQIPNGPSVNSFTGGPGSVNSHSSSDVYNIVINTPAMNASQIVREVAQEIKTRTGRTAKFSN